MTDADRQALEALDARLRILLPEQYQDSYEDVQPVSMGSAGLKYGPDGQVAWDEMWGSFCDLAMAGGPPHKGTLLEPGTEAEVDAQLDRYDEVADEICRGITMVTGLRAYVSLTPGWVSVSCPGEVMPQWLARAVTMENVAARRRGSVLDLPAAPHFRLEKEVKNVVTVMAKTSHYWIGHIPPEQQEAIGILFAQMSQESPLVEPAYSGADGLSGWRAIQTPSVGAAVWMMRALVAGNVLSRREASTLLVPLNHDSDPGGAVVSNAVDRVLRLAILRGVWPGNLSAS